jgi:hypothetical protein
MPKLEEVRSYSEEVRGYSERAKTKKSRSITNASRGKGKEKRHRDLLTFSRPRNKRRPNHPHHLTKKRPKKDKFHLRSIGT